MSKLITTPSERNKRNNEKMMLVIQFLKQETYTNFDNLMILLNYKDKNPLYRLLNKLVALGYVRKHTFNFQIGNISIFGITDLGLTQHIRSINEDFRSFEPSKVSVTSLERKLMNQKVQLHLDRNNQMEVDA